MQYIGLQHQISRNNRNSFLLLITFPLLLLLECYMFSLFADKQDVESTNQHFLTGAPFVIIVVCIWFLIAWAGHAAYYPYGSPALNHCREPKTNESITWLKIFVFSRA